MDDRSLLQQFIADRSEAAFAEVVRRHVDLVYSAARRQVNDPATADDVTQGVFILLARKARTIRAGEALPGWLLTTTRFVAINALRSAARRSRHEREAALMKSQMPNSADDEWESIRPMLDEAITRLKRPERDAITLRYFKGQSNSDIAQALGITEMAAQKRVHRAVQKLRAFFMRRGVAASPEGLAGVLAAHAVAAAPAALKTGITHSALTAPAAGSLLADQGTVILMAATKTKLAVAASAIAVVLAVGAPAVIYLRGHDPKPAETARTDSSSVTPAAAQPQAASDTNWQERFDATYSLVPGQIVKRIGGPFIPERDKYMTAFLNRVNGANAPSDAVTPRYRAPVAIVFFYDTTASPRQWQSVPWTFRDVLRDVGGVWSQDTDFDRDTLARLVVGDWIVQSGATPEQRLPALMAALGELIPLGTTFEMKPMQREAIVVTGTLAYAE